MKTLVRCALALSVPLLPAAAGCSQLAGDAYFVREIADGGSSAADASPADADAATAEPCNDEGAHRCVGTGGFQTCDQGVWLTLPCGSARVCVDGSCVTPRSCSGWMASSACGGNESCCSSPLVTGGTFLRDYDGVAYPQPAATTTVSDFRLDKYEVTVGRFRQFVAAALATTPAWVPPPGSGKHAHLRGGQGVAVFDQQGMNFGNEGGWDPLWNATATYAFLNLTGIGDVAQALHGDYCKVTPNEETWDPSGANDLNPMNCISWYEAYAFCIWDGGFLPTESEWNYAASGGADQREYPWSAPLDAGAPAVIDTQHANYCASPPCRIDHSKLVVGWRPAGYGRWGHADLAGNLSEWSFDVSVTPYPPGCTDCAVALRPGMASGDGGAGNRASRGGSFWDGAPMQHAAAPNGNIAAGRYSGYGFRCARSP